MVNACVYVCVCVGMQAKKKENENEEENRPSPIWQHTRMNESFIFFFRSSIVVTGVGIFRGGAHQ